MAANLPRRKVGTNFVLTSDEFRRSISTLSVGFILTDRSTSGRQSGGSILASGKLTLHPLEQRPILLPIRRGLDNRREIRHGSAYPRDC